MLCIGSDFRHLTGFDSAYVSSMLNLYVMQYSVENELNIEKEKENFLGYLTNPYEYLYGNVFNIID